MNGDEMRHWIWLALLWLGSMAGLWAGISGGYPPAVFSMLACWVLGVTWLVASISAHRTATSLRPVGSGRRRRDTTSEGDES